MDRELLCSCAADNPVASRAFAPQNPVSISTAYLVREKLAVKLPKVRQFCGRGSGAEKLKTGGFDTWGPQACPEFSSGSAGPGKSCEEGSSRLLRRSIARRRPLPFT